MPTPDLDTGRTLRHAGRACGMVCQATARAWPCHRSQGHDGPHESMLADVDRAIAWTERCATCDPDPETTQRHGMYLSRLPCPACVARMTEGTDA